jgi:hypothetical protein
MPFVSRATIGSVMPYDLINVLDDLTFNETIFALTFTIDIRGHPISNIYSSESNSLFFIADALAGEDPNQDDVWAISNISGLYQSDYFINTEKKLLDFLYNEPRFIVHCVQSNSDTKAVLASNIQNYSDVPIITVPTNRFVSIYITDQNNNLIDVFGEHSYMLDWYIAWFIRIDFVYELV